MEDAQSQLLCINTEQKWAFAKGEEETKLKNLKIACDLQMCVFLRQVSKAKNFNMFMGLGNVKCLSQSQIIISLDQLTNDIKIPVQNLRKQTQRLDRVYSAHNAESDEDDMPLAQIPKKARKAA